MQKNTKNISGVLVVDKPTGITSHDVIYQVRKLISKIYNVKPKVGHSGTLDPFATGVLIVAIGSATRLLEYTGGLPKTYIATLTFGASSDTDDITGTLTPNKNRKPIDRGVIEQALKQFIGNQLQNPPSYAAIKVQGKKLYEYARAGQEIKVKPRPISIHNIKIIEYTYPELSFQVSVSAGTYIRALARDIGSMLNTSAYLKKLRRTSIGTFIEQNANSVAKLEKSPLTEHILPQEILIQHMPSKTLQSDNVAKFKNGQAIAIPPVEHSKETDLAIFDESKNFLGIGRYDADTSLLYSSKVMP